MTYTENYSVDIKRLESELKAADAVIIGAGAGLSTAAGYEYSGERFNKYFSDFAEKYGFSDMYSGGFYPYEAMEEYWAFWSRYIYLNRYTPAPLPVYENLLSLVKDKNYFVITTNVDHCFQRAGFDKNRLFYTQGDYGLFQCSVPCHNSTYDNKDIIRQMFFEQKNLKIPSYLVPKCPKCGAPMVPNLRADNTFVEDEGWHSACARYEKFIDENKGKRLLLLELGVGFNTPVIIKYPFMRMAAKYKNAFYVCVNKGEAYIPAEIKSKSLSFNCGIAEVINALLLTE